MNFNPCLPLTSNLIVHLRNGKKLQATLPMDAPSDELKRLLEANELVIHTDGLLVTVPWSKVHYVEVTSFPAVLDAVTQPSFAISTAKGKISR